MRRKWLYRLIFFSFSLCFFGVARALADDPSTPVAIIDGEAISLEEVEKAIGARVSLLKEQIYQLQRQRIDALINDRLVEREAARRGVTVTQLLEAEVASKIPRVADDEVEAFYQANKDRLPDNEPDLRVRIRARLENQKLSAQRSIFLDQLRSTAKVAILLKQPEIYRANLATDNAPFKGGLSAAVKIVEFEDFHCPFCKESQQTMEQLLLRYKDRVKVIHKDFPIDELHPGARPAHLAARCANEQGKFWPYHDALFANAPKAAPDDLRKYAIGVGLNIAAFNNCVASSKYRDEIQRDIEEGKQAGVTGTPAFFINGRLVPGAQPLDRFVQLIEQELAQQP
jgi:protein-disulfide isomerase